MSDLELIDAVAKKTGEDSHEIRRRGFILTGPEDAGADLDPECMRDLVDLPETGTVDWDALGFGCREPFYLQSDSWGQVSPPRLSPNSQFCVGR
ncbi:MAG: hypothetical protein NTY25_00470 [Planctomycetia bacterium]|nr:hypothetical protein [Planctomycetia bacterium]